MDLGATVTVLVEGPGGRWSWARGEDGWTQLECSPRRATAAVTIDQATFWRLCSRGIDPPTARSRAHTTGPSEITDALTALVAIVLWHP